MHNLDKLKKRYANDNKIGKYSFSFINTNYQILKKYQLARERKLVTLKLFLKNKVAVFSCIMLILTILLGLIMPFFTDSPTYIDPSRKHNQIFENGHIIGTDLAGRDMWSRLWHGLRFSLGLAAIATLIDIILGVIIGILMGYFEKFDRFMQFGIQVISNVPSLFILTIFVLIWDPTFWVLALSMTLNGWIPMAQYARSEILKYKISEYTNAEKLLGTPTVSILKSYIPQMIPIIITRLVFTIPVAIQYDASLALIGLAVPNVASIGNMISDATPFVTQYPLEVIYPLLFMISIIIYVQFIGNGLENALQGRGKNG